MVEPLHPGLRDALKRAHTGLTDEDIDRFEELTSQRFTLDPRKNQAQIRELDLERNELLKQKMPRFQHVKQVFEAERGGRETARPGKPKVRIEFKSREG